MQSLLQLRQRLLLRRQARCSMQHCSRPLQQPQQLSQSQGRVQHTWLCCQLPLLLIALWTLWTPLHTPQAASTAHLMSLAQVSLQGLVQARRAVLFPSVRVQPVCPAHGHALGGLTQ